MLSSLRISLLQVTPEDLAKKLHLSLHDWQANLKPFSKSPARFVPVPRSAVTNTASL